VEVVSERETQVKAFVPGVGFVAISTCAEHFEAAIGEDGTGYLYNATTTSMSGPPCTRTQCDEANMNKTPWPLNLSILGLSMEVDYCLRAITSGEGSAGTPCHVNLILWSNNATGAHAFSANSAPCENLGGGVQLTGHWAVVPVLVIRRSRLTSWHELVAASVTKH
jgi:hypothetical protein